MKWIVGGVLGAWGGIGAPAWWLADQRIERSMYGSIENMSQVATRDNVLIGGLAIPLGLFVWLLLKGLVRFERLNRRGQAPKATSRELRPRRD